ncbi:MAG: HlyD family efflux transporter periplasmic adaptor subunit [Bacteroidales bacterium]|nr:HlyD family efflux transporter periplasmic adaptor subunit [Bacteroidales bacterium]MCM1220369.1 HlyD family efflux transporter periplasmic adaptor subunit [Lachnospiraceae bacterium]
MSKRNQKKIDKLRTEFLPEALEIVERPTAPLGNIIIWLVFALLFVFVLWACIGKLDEVASARGQIAADEGIQEVQAAETGIVRTVKVKEGDAVHRGDVLYCIEKEIEQKNIAYSEGEIGLLELQIELLGKLLAGEDITEYQNEDYPVQQQEVIETMIAMNEVDELSIEEYELAAQTAKNQYELADRNLGSNQDKADYLNEQKKLQDKSNRLKSTLEIELELLKGNYEYTAAEAAKYQELYEAGAKSKAEWEEKANEVENLKKQIAIKEIEIKNEALTQKSDEKNIDYQIAESKNESENQKGTLEDRKKNYESAVKNLETAKSQRKEKLYEMRQQCLEELKKYDLQIAEQYNQFENMDIVALYDGVVKSLAVDKAGSVVTAAQVVAEIIPDSTTMIVKAEVNNRDIGYVALGQDVDVKVDTYDYQKYGKLHGVVTYISPDATETEQAQKIYKVEILLEKDSGKDWTVSQGMECTVEIKTDKRRIIDFFLEPLTDALDRGLKER